MYIVYYTIVNNRNFFQLNNNIDQIIKCYFQVRPNLNISVRRVIRGGVGRLPLLLPPTKKKKKKKKMGPINQMQEVPRIIKLIYNKFQFMWHLPTEE